VQQLLGSSCQTTLRCSVLAGTPSLKSGHLSHINKSPMCEQTAPSVLSGLSRSSSRKTAEEESAGQCRNRTSHLRVKSLSHKGLTGLLGPSCSHSAPHQRACGCGAAVVGGSSRGTPRAPAGNCADDLMPSRFIVSRTTTPSPRASSAPVQCRHPTGRGKKS